MKLTIKRDMILVAVFLLVVGGIYWNSRAHVLTFDEYRDMYLAKVLMQGQYSYFGDAFYKHPPLYMMAVAASSFVFGYGEDAGLIVSILFALGSLFVTYIFVSQAVNKKVALASIAILAFNPSFAKFARDLRFEIATGFFFILSVYLFWKYFETRKRSFLLFTSVSIGLGLLTKSFIFFLYPAFIVFGLLMVKKGKYSFKSGLIDIATVVVVSLLIYSPWLIYTNINHGPSQIAAQWEEFTGHLSWAPDYVSPPYYYYFLQLHVLMTIPIFLFVVLGIYSAYKKSNTSLILLASWILIYLFLVSSIGWKENRFLLNLVSGLSVFAAIGMFWLAEKIPIKFKYLPFVILAFSIVPGIIYSDNSLYGDDKSIKEWRLWSAIESNVPSNEYVLANNYAMVDLYSRPSDYLLNNLQFDVQRILSFDSNYILLDPSITYPSSLPKVFEPVQEFRFKAISGESNLTLYKVNLKELSYELLGNNSIIVHGKITDIDSGKGVFRSKIYFADPNTQQIILAFYTKQDGTFTAYLPSTGVYLLQVNSFGYQSKTFLTQIDSDKILLCTSQQNCIAKTDLSIGLPFQSFITHDYPSSRF